VGEGRQQQTAPGQTVLVLEPAEGAAARLNEALGGEASVTAVEGMDDLCQRMTGPDEDPDAIVVAAEALADEGAHQLRAALEEQPAWSSVPVIVLISGAEPPAEVADLGRATLLPRSAPLVSLVSVLRAALQDRSRQHEIRDHLRALARANERKDMLLGELSHRVKNTLAVIQAIVSETRRMSSSMDGFVEALEGRLHSLAVSHDALQSTRWQGGDLDRVLSKVMSPFLGTADAGRVLRTGPPVTLRPEATQAMSMIFHELASNAAKYGALSCETGRALVHWRLEHGELRIEWREEGGPPARSPERRGYGTSLIEQLAPYQFGGASRLWYEPAGLRCEITLPQKNLVPPYT
jgi:two-component sensor histidine kinase